MNFIAWPEIESFHNIRKFVKAYPENLHGNVLVQYRSKVKLHGTNAAVHCLPDRTVVAQSRTQLLVDGQDNAGFAKWVRDQEGKNSTSWSAVAGLAERAGYPGGVIVYGEWCGTGIQKGVSISDIGKKVFAVFAARTLDGSDQFIVEPTELQKIVNMVDETYVLPWYNYTNGIDWSASAEFLALKVDQINEWVHAVETNDPWVEATFGVKGTGEGLVFYPVSKEHLGFANFSNLVFKAKGEKHKNIKTAAPAQVDASSAASVTQFVDMVLTDARLEQGARAVQGEHKHEESLKCLFCVNTDVVVDMKSLGQFIKWIVADVQKETQDELEASGLEWKQVSKPVGDRARAWYLEKVKAL